MNTGSVFEMVPVCSIPLLVTATVIMLAEGYGNTLPDPTRPADFSTKTVIREEQPQELTNWHLTGIRTSAEGRSAIVNGMLVKIGDEIENATVLEITSKSVVLDYNKKRLEISLIRQSIKKSVSKTE